MNKKNKPSGLLPGAVVSQSAEIFGASLTRIAVEQAHIYNSPHLATAKATSLFLKHFSSPL